MIIILDICLLKNNGKTVELQIKVLAFLFTYVVTFASGVYFLRKLQVAREYSFILA